MDPLNIINNLALIISLVDLGVLRNTGALDYEKWKQCVRLGKDNAVYGVWDMPLAGDTGWNSRIGKLIWGPMEGLPVISPPDEDKIRLTIYEGSKDELVSDSKRISGFTALSSQWRKDDLYSWYSIKTYETEIPARVLRGIRVSEDQDRGRQVELECQTFVVAKAAAMLDGQPPAGQFFTTAKMALELNKLDCDYRLIRSSANWKQAFLLQFQHASLCFFADFLANLVLQDKEGRDDDIDPAWAELRRYRA